MLTAGGSGAGRRTGPGGRVAVVRTGKRLDFVLDGDGSALKRVLVRTTPRPQARAALAPPKQQAEHATAETGGTVPCPDSPETITVTVGVRVPSWADDPFSAGFTIPRGDCPGASSAIVPGSLPLLQGKFTLSDGGGTGSTNPGVTASWN